jgi:2-octaprenyl-6-methoxyphenol hydroxylase
LNSGLLTSVKFNNNIYNYNLVIVCAGNNSNLIKSIFDDTTIDNSYKETAITTTLSHSSIKNNIARQFFLGSEILALLPISNTKTSIVWIIKNSKNRKNITFLKNKIKLYTKNYLKKVKIGNKIEFKKLNLLIRKKYFLDRTLLFGDALHVMHPFVGQGFNMTLRDLICLEKILKNKISLGLDIGSSDILSEFSNEAKPRNLTFLLGADILKRSLSYKNFRDGLLKVANKNAFAKNIFFDFADKGFKF